MAFVHLGAELVGLWTIFHNTDSIAGWNKYQVLALLGVFRIMVGVIGMAIGPNMRRLMEDVRQGTLDYVLLKPVNSQFYVSARSIVIWRSADILIGLAVALYASTVQTGGVRWTDLLLFVLLLLAGTVIIYSFWLVLASLSFWFTRISNIEMVFWNLFEAGRYPIQIYRRWIRLALTFLIPLAFLTTFPSSALVGKLGASSLPIAMLFATIAFVSATLFWRHAVSRYSGASA
jgi:ABC-2 type transport system permease protein